MTGRFAHYRFNSQDYSQPVYPETNAGVSRYNQWKQSLNYNFDQSTNTGDTRIRDGYRVRVTQTIRDTECNYGASYIHYNVGIESAFPPIYSSDEATASAPVKLDKKFRVEKSTDAGRVLDAPYVIKGQSLAAGGRRVRMTWWCRIGLLMLVVLIGRRWVRVSLLVDSRLVVSRLVVW